jgi:hypothetical protein
VQINAMQQKGLKENVRRFIIFEHHAHLFEMIKNNQKDDGKIAHRGAKVKAAKGTLTPCKAMSTGLACGKSE